MTATTERATVRETVELARPATRGLVLSTVLGAACIASSIGLLATSAWLISRCAEHGSVADLGLAVVSVRFFALARGLFRYGERLVGHNGAFRSLASLRVRIYERLERVVPAGLHSPHRGDLLARLVADVDALQDVGLRVLPAWFVAAIVGLATTAVLWWILPSAAVAVGLLLLVGALVVPAVSRGLAKRAERTRAPARGDLTAAVVDLLEGAPDLVAFGATDAQLQRVLTHDAELTRVAAASAHTAGIGAALIALCTGLATWAALALGVSALHDGRIRGVMLAVVALIPLAAFELVTPLPTAAQSLEAAQRSTARLQAVLEQPPAIVDPLRPATLDRTRRPDLRVRGLRARYSDGDPWAVDGLDLDLTPGRRIALVGPSGAGKSTVASVLVRLADYQEGSVQLDGTELHDLAADDVRRVIGLVEQDAHIFDSTLRENLRIARPDAADDTLVAALAGARLSAWFEALPEGLDTPLGTHGSTLSGGQRQRLAVARALVADFPILILDEPGEHLDAETADALTRDLLSATEGRTTLLITHRLAALESIDEIIVLERGRTTAPAMRGVA